MVEPEMMARPDADSPWISTIRSPRTTRLNTSRPKLSVPKGWSHDGPVKGSPTSIVSWGERRPPRPGDRSEEVQGQHPQ